MTLCKFKRIIVLGLLFVSSNIFSQKRNSIAIQTGLFHCFFDHSQILNIKYPSNYNTSVFNGLLLNSIGLTYNRLLNIQSSLFFEYARFWEDYPKNSNSDITKPVINQRVWNTFGIIYERKLALKKSFEFVYGLGINYRHGYETVILYKIKYPYWNELVTDFITRRDIGLNVFVGINYSFSSRFFLFSKLDMLGIIYVNDRRKKEKFDTLYHAPQFPSRFDASIKFGIGFRF